MEISQLIDAEWSYREGPSCRQNAKRGMINRAEAFSSFSFQLLAARALAVGRGWQELLNYFRAGGDLQCLLFSCEEPGAQEGTIGSYPALWKEKGA